MRISNISQAEFNNNNKIAKQKQNNNNFQTHAVNNNYVPLTNQYLAFLGGYSVDLKQTVNQLNENQFPPQIRQQALQTLECGNPEDKTLYDIHLDKYKKILDCYSLEELKEKYPEFKDAKSAWEVDANKNSLIYNFQNGQSEIFSPQEDLTLQLIKLYWGQGFSLSDISKYIEQNDSNNTKNAHYSMGKKLNIPLLNPRYAIVLKLSNKEYNEKFTEQMSIKRKEAHEAKQQLYEGEGVVIPSGSLSEAHKKHISEGLKKYYQENPEASIVISERQRQFYIENPEEKEKRHFAMDYAWNKTKEGKSVLKHLNKFIKKYNNTNINEEQLSGIEKLDEKQKTALAAFFKKNAWAKEQLSKAVKKGYIALEKTLKMQQDFSLIQKKSYTLEMFPKALREDMKKYAQERNLELPDIGIGTAYIYAGENKDTLETKNAVKKVQSIIDKYSNDYKNTADDIATSRQIAIIAFKNKLEKNLEKYTNNDVKILNEKLNILLKEFPIYINPYTQLNIKVPVSGISGEIINSLYYSIGAIASELNNGQYFLDLLGKTLDEAYDAACLKNEEELRKLLDY